MTSAIRSLFIMLVIAGLRPGPTQAQPAAPFNWKTIAADLEAADYTYRTGAFQTSQFTAFRTGLKNFRVQVLLASDYGRSRMEVKDLCEAGHAALCINANFFDPSGQALGLVVTRGMVMHGVHRGGNTLTGIFYSSLQKIGIINREKLTLEGVVEAVQAGPRLLSGGRPVSGLRETATSRRSGICIDNSQRLIFFAIADSWTQSTNADVTRLLLDPAVSCVDALNLDGGGSSQLFLGTQALNSEIGPVWLPGRDPVPVALALVPLSVKS